MWNIRFTFVKLTATVIQAEDFILPQLHIRSKQNFFNRRLYRKVYLFQNLIKVFKIHRRKGESSDYQSGCL